MYTEKKKNNILFHLPVQHAIHFYQTFQLLLQSTHSVDLESIHEPPERDYKFK